MPQQVTKNDIYAQLVRLGIERGYEVIPEFRVKLPDHQRKQDRKKNIDLVWVTRKSNISQHQNCKSLEYWTLHATFEIDACDVRNIKGKEFDRHMRDLPTIKNIPPTESIRHFVVLYNAAYDRAWNNERKTTDDEIEERRRWAAKSKSGVDVIDGRDLAVILALPQAATRST
ncbi:MAG: hypothetical protein WA344_17425 [Ralstonia pickettii]